MTSRETQEQETENTSSYSVYNSLRADPNVITNTQAMYINGLEVSLLLCATRHPFSCILNFRFPKDNLF